jgi:hypothetical protein
MLGLKRGLARHLIALLTLTLIPLAASSAQDKEKKKLPPDGVPVIWKDPGNIRAKDLRLGPGGAAMRPDLRRVRFIEEEKGGYSTKYRIKDARGNEWVAKIGNEAQSETAAVRLLWAIGYPTEVNYLVPRLRIPGHETFENVRLEARPKSLKRGGEWHWKDNPFLGTRELQGLKVMMLLLNNWDIKDENNVILYRPGGTELLYTISDLGATFGKTGSLPVIWRITRSRNKPEDFAEAKFIEKVEDGRVNFKYGGKMGDIFDDITVPQARWVGGLLSRLSDRQIADAFRAANYSSSEVRTLTGALRWRINQLANLPGRSTVASR